MYSQLPLQTNRWFVDRRWLGWLLLLALSLVGVSAVLRQPLPLPPAPAGLNRPDGAASSMAFVPQADHFVAQWGQAMLRFEPQAVTLAGAESSLRWQFVGASEGVTLVGEERRPGVVHYLVGDDPVGWQHDLPTFAGVRYQGLYPGIELQFSGQADGLAALFTVAAGADPGRVQWQFAEPVALAEDGALRLAGGASFTPPQAWQLVEGQWVGVPAGYRLLTEKQVALSLGGYEPALPLFFQLTLNNVQSLETDFSYDSGEAIAVDPAGNIYVAGSTRSGDFPVVDPLQGLLRGSYDAFVTKFAPDGHTMLYSTYLGGLGHDGATGIAVDAAGQVYLTGITESTNFPTVAPLQPFLRGQRDAFVARLTADGQALVYSTYLGGTGNDFVEGIAVDSHGWAVLTGVTNSHDFPLANPLQSLLAGSWDLFISRLSPAGDLLTFSTYLGGTDSDDGYAIAVDADDSLYVAGGTNSPDFPLLNPAQAALGGYSDAFVLKLVSAADNMFILDYSTYLGGSSYDRAFGLAVDGAGQAVIVGETGSTDFPLHLPLQSDMGQANDAFATKLSPNGQFVYSTFLGGNRHDYGTGAAVDGLGRAYITLVTWSQDLPLINPVQPPPPPSDPYPPAFIMNLSPDGQQFVYSSWLGENQDAANDIAASDDGEAYVTGTTSQLDVQYLTPADVIMTHIPAGGGHIVSRIVFGGTTYYPPPTDVTLTGAPEAVVAQGGAMFLVLLLLLLIPAGAGLWLGWRRLRGE